jgi:hypothetical protein
MEGREKPNMDKYKEITNDWIYDTSCMLTSLLVSGLKNFKHLIFVAHSGYLQGCEVLSWIYGLRSCGWPVP